MSTNESSLPDIAPGSLFGRYELLERIAVGGMAEIVLARTTTRGVAKTCALKRILPQYSRDVNFVSMFIDEARITIGLEHRNIVRLFDFGQHDGTYFMAMEFVDGVDLSTVLRRHARQGRGVDPAIATFIAREICEGLAHAHALTDARGRPLGVVHRDVSPQNVLIARNGDVKVGDFGIAAAKNKLSLTQPGTVLGKAGYIAPEQAQGKGATFRSDLWSVGVTLWEMLVGERLFSGDNPMHMLQRVLGEPLVAPSTKNRDARIPASLDDVVMTLLQRDPTRRFASTNDAARALSLVLLELPVKARAGDRLCDARDVAAMLARTDEDASQHHRIARHVVAEPDLYDAPTDAPNLPSHDATHVVAPHSADADLNDLIDRLERRPDLWTLVKVAERSAAVGDVGFALSAWRTAAAVFAYRGLLVQCLCAHHPARRHMSREQAFDDVMRLGDLTPGDRAGLADVLASFDQHGVWPLLQRADPRGLGSKAEPRVAVPAVPLLSTLGPREFARLAEVIDVRIVRRGDTLVRERHNGDTLFAIGRGRFVVSCTPGAEDRLMLPGTGGFEDDGTASDAGAASRRVSSEGVPSDRVWLAGLGDGDFCGEFSFLTERPRAATIEALTDGVVLGIDRADVAHLVDGDPAFVEPLMRFYKERVVELMMARSPVFSLLTPDDRRALLDQSPLVDHRDGEVIVAEGAQSDDVFFIKAGEVEVFRRDEGGMSIFINKLGQGQFFGEISALRGTPRTVSVRAIGRCSAFRIDGRALRASVEREPRLRALLGQIIASRSAETRARVAEHQALIVGT